MAIEIVSFPIKNGAFPVRYVVVPSRVKSSIYFDVFFDEKLHL